MGSSEYSRHNEINLGTISLQRILNFYKAELVLWTVGEANDNESFQRMRARGFYEMSKAFENIISQAQLAELQIRLTIGKAQINGFRFKQGLYDIYSKDALELGPGSDVVLDRAEKWSIDDTEKFKPSEYYPERSELYVGNLYSMIPISSVARTLAQSGELSACKVVQETNTV